MYGKKVSGDDNVSISGGNKGMEKPGYEKGQHSYVGIADHARYLGMYRQAAPGQDGAGYGNLLNEGCRRFTGCFTAKGNFK